MHVAVYHATKPAKLQTEWERRAWRRWHFDAEFALMEMNEKGGRYRADILPRAVADFL
jgi:hypothetical protein